MKSKIIKTNVQTDYSIIMNRAIPGNYDDARIQVRTINNIPDDISDKKLLHLFDCTVDLTWLLSTTRLTFDYDELGEGVIIKC